MKPALNPADGFGQAETILVVDDSHENRLFLSKYILAPAGYKVLTARDGSEGLAMALAHHPDLLLMDLQMPQMNGVEVIHALQASGLAIPIILMTLHGSEEIAIQVFRLGIKDYILKPFTPKEILASIERALVESRLRRERDALTQRLVRANRRLERRLHELNALAGIGRSVTALMDPHELHCRVLEGGIYLVRGDQGSIHIGHPQENQLFLSAIRDHHQPCAVPVLRAISDPLAEKVIQSRQALRASAAQGDLQLPPGAQAAIYVPLMVGTRAIGAIGVLSSRPGRQFTGDDESLLGAVADYAAVALENTRLFHELETAKEREKQEIRQIFQTYVAPSVVDQVIADPARVRLGGVRQQITTLYADIRGFTSFAEQISPEGLIYVLNGYLSAMASTVIKHEGTLDKFLGDAVMAFFNAPMPQPDHALRAARAALAIQQAVAQHRQAETTTFKLDVGVGFATGEAIVGNVGTTDQMDYTVIGDSVNLARRLQEEAKPGQILMDKTTRHLLDDHVEVVPLGELPLKGKSRPETIFELIAFR